MLNEKFSSNNFSKKHISFFKKEGYILAKKVISLKDIQILRKSIHAALQKVLGSEKVDKIFNGKDPNKQMILLRKKRPDLFAKFFDTLQTLSSIYLAISNEKIINIVSKLLGINNHALTLTDVGIRLDAPHVTRNSLGWHQDSSYYRQNNNGKNGIVLWIPIFEIEKNMGNLQYLRYSHKLGPLNTPKKKQSGKFASKKRNINSQSLKNFKEVLKSKANVGDALLMNHDMVHRSGRNLNKNKVRVTMLARFHNMLSNDFNPGFNVYKYSDKKLNFSLHGF